MKKLFDFHLMKTIKETKSESSKNDKGETVTVEKEVETDEKQKIFLRKPNRPLYDEAELFYGVRLSEGIKAGLLTRALLAKRFSNDGGVLSEEDKNRYADLYLKLYETQMDIDKLTSIPHKKRTKEQDQNLEDMMNESTIARRELTDFEMGQSALFEQTAENRARNKTILWWALHLSYFEDEDGKPNPVFSSGSYEERLDVYDEMEESSDNFDEELIQKLLYYVSFWYVGKVSSEEDFKRLLAETEGESEEEVSKEEASKEEASKEEASKEKAPKEEAPKEEAPKKEAPKEEAKAKEIPPKEEPKS